jgi:hypothetical protein
MPPEPITIEPPPHPLPALATFELNGYRRQLEQAIESYQHQHPATPVPAGLRDGLAKVRAEQADRARIAARNA